MWLFTRLDCRVGRRIRSSSGRLPAEEESVGDFLLSGRFSTRETTGVGQKRGGGEVRTENEVFHVRDKKRVPVYGLYKRIIKLSSVQKHPKSHTSPVLQKVCVTQPRRTSRTSCL